MHAQILVINPNSSVAVTALMDQAVQELGFTGAPEIVCTTLTEGPTVIETEADIIAVIDPLYSFIASHPAAAYIIGCFSDPGLDRARSATSRPVLGIGESAMRTAAGRSQFGIISILEGSVARHRRYAEHLGLATRLAGDLALGIPGLELLDAERTWPKLLTTGIRLRDECGAEAVILGCAGMSSYRQRLQSALGVPVIDPTQAAAAMACSALQRQDGVAG